MRLLSAETPRIMSRIREFGNDTGKNEENFRRRDLLHVILYVILHVISSYYARKYVIIALKRPVTSHRVYFKY